MTTPDTRSPLDHLFAVQAALGTEPEPPKAILTVGVLRDLLDQLTEQGIDQDTAVVVADDGWYNEIEAAVDSPLEHTPERIWLTLTEAGPADARFTPGHWPREEAEEVDPTVPVVDLVAGALKTFWEDEHLSYKAAEYDAAHYVAVEVSKVRPDMTWSDAALRRAADLAFVVGQFGVDQITARSFHAMLAVAIFETEDVL